MAKILPILAVIVLVVFIWIGLSNRPPIMSASPSPIASSVPSFVPSPVASVHPYDDLIVVDVPQDGAVVASPLTITGKARGSWYFEASFPVRLLDSKGQVVAEGHAQAQGEWMTSEFVPFIAKLEFIKPSSERGTLVLENDNPSGDPKNAKKIEVPVKFE
jgi:hypothetical protein